MNFGVRSHFPGIVRFSRNDRIKQPSFGNKPGIGGFDDKPVFTGNGGLLPGMVV